MALKFLNNGTFSGSVSAEDNIYLTDAGTVRGKIQLNASDRDDLDIKAVSLGSNMKFFTVDTERMRIDSSGNVGIGEINVDARLHITALASSGISNIKLESPGASKWAFGIPAGQTYFALDDTNDNLSTPKLVVLKTSGNVGIGTDSPDRKLHVNSGTDNANTLFESTDTAVTVRFKDSTGEAELECRNDWRFSNNAGANERMRIDSSGNVLINSGVYLSWGTNGASSIEGSTVSNKIQFRTNSTNAVIIDSSQNVGINTTSPDFKLDVNGTFGVSDLPGNATSTSVLVKNETIGPELLSNGDFTGNPDLWSGDESIANGQLTKTANGLAYQSISLTDGATYYVTVDVASISGSPLIYAAGSQSGSLSAGLNELYLVAGGSNSLFGINNGSGSVFNSISLKLVTSASNQVQARQLGSGSFGDELWAVTPTDSNDIYNLNSANVGIGTDLPSEKLEVAGNVGVNGFITHNGDSGTFMGWSANDTNVFYTAGNERMRIDSNGVIQLTSGINGYLNTNSIGMEIDINRNPETGAFTDAGLSHARIIMRGDTTANGGSNIKFVTSSTVNTVGTTKMTIEGDGNVGIGYASPSDFTSVYADNLVVGPLSGNNGITVNSATSGYGALAFADGTGASDQYRGLIQYNHTANSLALFTNASTKMTILSGGNVGINTTLPQAKLDVREDANNVYTAYFYNTDTNSNSNGINVQTATTNANAYAFRVNSGSNSNALVVKGNANVGIGEDAPGTLLSLKSPLANTSIVTLKCSKNDSSWTVGDRIGGINFFGEDGSGQGAGIKGSINYIVESTSGGSNGMTFNVAGTSNNMERIRINSSGNVGIGVTGPTTRLNPIVTANSESMTLGSAANMGFKLGNTSTNIYGICMGVGDSGRGWIQVGRTDSTAIAYDLSLQASGGNVGIGTASPFTNLEVAGSGADSIIRLYAAGGTANIRTWEIRAVGVAGEGLLFRQVNDANNSYTNRMIIDTGGNVGIGTITPDSKLDVTGGDITVNTSGVGFMNFKYGSVGSESTMGSIQTTGIDLKINATSDLLLLPGSNVGIGTTSPDYKLEVQGVISSADAGLQKATFANVGNDLVLTANADATNVTANILFKSSGSGGTAVSEKMRINSIGNVGIGEPNPNYKLNVASGTNTDGIYLSGLGNAMSTGEYRQLQFGYSDTDTSYGSTIRFVVPDATTHGGQIEFYTDAGPGSSSGLGALALGMLIDDHQRVGIGATSPECKLHVVSTTTDNTKTVLIQNSSTGDASIMFNISGDTYSLGIDNSDGDKFKLSYGALGTNDRLVIDSSGNATFAGDVVAYSDKKLKKNIKTLDGSKVYKMRGVSFDRIDTGKKSSGVIAQEIQEIAPELVNESDGTLGVAYGNLTGYLIEAIKELKAEIEELKKYKCDCKK